ncbi:hypothetical protein Acr_20g0008000 [Actinidia rufa]|uniref:Uncharacterized protein n=1 Tax=Actinidia rufa TaxID=165716 RepID=A0A7J0GE42_9ERIC|nr:hypothetical protein Acr_20g0008000 [Actinidia rufa]
MRAKSGLLLNGNGVSISGKLGSEQIELEDKISKIRAMARDALGLKRKWKENLVLLRKKLEKKSEKSGVLPVSLLRMLGEIGDGVDRERVSGFSRSWITRSRSSSSVVEDKWIGNGSVGNDSVDMLGVAQKTALRKPSVKSGRSRKSTTLDAKNSQSPTKEIQETTTISNEPDMLQRNSISKSREVGIKQAAGEVEGKQSDDKADLWWLNLPYVLAIRIRKGHEGEGQDGLYRLTTSPCTKAEGDFTVAFEDRGDATNFCYILESVFEDLGDFSADIVLLSIKVRKLYFSLLYSEPSCAFYIRMTIFIIYLANHLSSIWMSRFEMKLCEVELYKMELDVAVRSDTVNLIVVKKGQLELYAGQPLEEVETALSSLVKRS